MRKRQNRSVLLYLLLLHLRSDWKFMDLADPACDVEGMWLSYFEKCGIGVGDEFYLDMDYGHELYFN